MEPMNWKDNKMTDFENMNDTFSYTPSKYDDKTVMTVLNLAITRYDASRLIDAAIKNHTSVTKLLMDMFYELYGNDELEG